VAALAIALLAVLALPMPAKAAATAAELSGVAEQAAEAVAVVPETESVPVEAEVASAEAEITAPEAVPSEAAITQEAPVPTTPPSESQPELEPEPESAPVEAAGGGGGNPTLGLPSVKATGDLVRETAAHVRATAAQLVPSGRDVVPVPAAGEVAGKLAEPTAGFEQTLAALAISLDDLAAPLDDLAAPLEELAPLWALSPDGLKEFGSFAPTSGVAASAAGSTGPAAVPGELLSDPVARRPERRLPAAIDPDLQSMAPIATETVTPISPSSAGGGTRSSHLVSPGASVSSSPGLPVLLSADDQAPVANATSVGAPAGPLSPGRLSADTRAGSSAGGSNFIPLLGLLALLALVAPRGYRRCMAVRDLPVPMPFICALERPG
jgi:hypothetical protein